MIYSVADLIFAGAAGALACGAVAALLPAGGGPMLRMVLGMAAGMALGHLLGLVFSVPLGMFEAMYLGAFSGMYGGMMGAMAGPGTPLTACALYGLLIGAAVWTIHCLLNRYYQKRR